MASTSFVYMGGQTYGPYSDDELQAHVRGGKVAVTAYIHDGAAWFLLASKTELLQLHPDFEVPPTATPTKKSAKSEIVSAAVTAESVSYSGSGAVSAETIWFVVRDKKKYGPYSAADLIGQLQRKELTTSAFVWRPGFNTWQKMSQVGEFSRDSLRRLASDGAGVDILVKRKHVRAPYDVEVIAHDNTKAIEGRTMVIGEGGLFLATPRPMHPLGTRLKLHFREGGTPSFNAVAEIVSVIHQDMPGYALKFVAIADTDRKRIAKLVSETSVGPTTKRRSS